MNKVIFYFAAIAWVLALTLHVTSILGHDFPYEYIFVWVILHVSAFLVGFAILASLLPKINSIRNKETNSINPYSFFKTVTESAPKLLILVAIISLIYVVVNVILFSRIAPNTVMEIEGYHLIRRNKIIDSMLSPDEYSQAITNSFLYLMGPCLFVYSLGMMVLYPFKKSEEVL